MGSDLFSSVPKGEAGPVNIWRLIGSPLKLLRRSASGVDLKPTDTLCCGICTIIRVRFFSR